jgi:MerR HTH family regulatory protein
MQENGVPILEQTQEQPSSRNSILTIFRGDIFHSNLDMLLNSPRALKNLEIVSKRTCEVKIENLSYRTLHHWDSVGLIECERESGSGWRKFNLIEAMWVHVIAKFRSMGVALDAISKAKLTFFEKIAGLELKYFDYYLIGALYFSTPVFFVTPNNAFSEFLSYEEMNHAMEVQLLNDCLLIHLNPLLNQIFHKIEIKSKFQLSRPVTPEQSTICDLMDQEDFDSFKIAKANGKISQVEIEKGYPRNVSYKEISENETDAVISTRISNGIVASRKRVKRVKLD